jgi:hypothetical protein
MSGERKYLGSTESYGNYAEMVLESWRGSNTMIVDINDRAVMEILEFVYQAYCTGVDKRILDLMDVTDEEFAYMLQASRLLEWHTDLATMINRDYPPPP